MIYTLENHELKHAVEEMLFHLLPTETLSRADTAEQITEPYCRSILTEENGEAAARAIVCMDGAVHEAEKRASVTGLATLDYKRTPLYCNTGCSGILLQEFTGSESRGNPI